MTTAYERLGAILEREPRVKGGDYVSIPTGAMYTRAHVRDEDDHTRTVTVCGHVVARAWSDGSVELDSHGYHTLSTGAGMRLAAPVWSVNGVFHYGDAPFEVTNGRERFHANERP